jgi:hypothetical protein
MTSADRIVMHGDLKPRSTVDRRRLRRATAADRLVEAHRHSRSTVVRTGGRASVAMEAAAHSPGVAVLVSADLVVAASAAGPTTARASALDHSRTAVDLQPLAGDRDAADAGGVKSMTTDVVGAGVTTAIDAPTNGVSYLDR